MTKSHKKNSAVYNKYIYLIIAIPVLAIIIAGSIIFLKNNKEESTTSSSLTINKASQSDSKTLQTETYESINNFTCPPPKPGIYEISSENELLTNGIETGIFGIYFNVFENGNKKSLFGEDRRVNLESAAFAVSSAFAGVGQATETDSVQPYLSLYNTMVVTDLETTQSMNTKEFALVAECDELNYIQNQLKTTSQNNIQFYKDAIVNSQQKIEKISKITNYDELEMFYLNDIGELRSYNFVQLKSEIDTFSKISTDLSPGSFLNNEGPTKEDYIEQFPEYLAQAETALETLNTPNSPLRVIAFDKYYFSFDNGASDLEADIEEFKDIYNKIISSTNQKM